MALLSIATYIDNSVLRQKNISPRNKGQPNYMLLLQRFEILLK